jgi:hypothetical protein
VQQEPPDGSSAAEHLIGFLVYLVTGNTGHSRLPIFVRHDEKSAPNAQAPRSP